MSYYSISIEQIKEASQKGSKHYFDKSTMQFFKSRVSKTALYNRDSGIAYFITSEQFEKQSRKYSIRKINMHTGNIETVGEFGEFNTRLEAWQNIIKILKETQTSKINRNKQINPKLKR
jgi:hypothetical protein